MSTEREVGGRATEAQEPGLIPGWDMAPGGPRAVSLGCLCSVLANAGFRARASVEPFIDPRCPLHAPEPAGP